MNRSRLLFAFATLAIGCSGATSTDTAADDDRDDTSIINQLNSAAAGKEDAPSDLVKATLTLGQPITGQFAAGKTDVFEVDVPAADIPNQGRGLGIRMSSSTATFIIKVYGPQTPAWEDGSFNVIPASWPATSTSLSQSATHDRFTIANTGGAKKYLVVVSAKTNDSYTLETQASSSVSSSSQNDVDGLATDSAIALKNCQANSDRLAALYPTITAPNVALMNNVQPRSGCWLETQTDGWFSADALAPGSEAIVYGDVAMQAIHTTISTPPKPTCDFTDFQAIDDMCVAALRAQKAQYGDQYVTGFCASTGFGGTATNCFVTGSLDGYYLPAAK